MTDHKDPNTLYDDKGVEIRGSQIRGGDIFYIGDKKYKCVECSDSPFIIPGKSEDGDDIVNGPYCCGQKMKFDDGAKEFNCAICDDYRPC